MSHLSILPTVFTRLDWLEQLLLMRVPMQGRTRPFSAEIRRLLICSQASILPIRWPGFGVMTGPSRWSDPRISPHRIEWSTATVTRRYALLEAMDQIQRPIRPPHRSPPRSEVSSPVVRLDLDLRQPSAQTIQVRQTCWPESSRVVVQLPVWTPGSYTVRDHAQHLHSLVAHCGDEAITARRIGPSRWQVEMPTRDELRLDYAIEARDLTVRTCHLDPDFASLSLAAVAMDVEGSRWHEHRLTVKVPEPWRVHVPLRAVDDAWIAEDDVRRSACRSLRRRTI